MEGAMAGGGRYDYGWACGNSGSGCIIFIGYIMTQYWNILGSAEAGHVNEFTAAKSGLEQKATKLVPHLWGRPKQTLSRGL